jgi:2-C-methyl-D-erythritol 4-phosphate cytidylyltransferase
MIAKHENLRIWGIIPAAGVGARMQAPCPKQYLSLAGKTVLETTLLRLKRLVMEQVSFKWHVGISEDDGFWPDLNIAQDQSIQTFYGGNERADTVLNGLRAIRQQASDDDWVLVHDAARPCFREEDIYRLISTLKQGDTGGILAVPVSDTLKRVINGDQDGNQKNQNLTANYPIQSTLDRSDVWGAQTPQFYRYKMLMQALELALKEGFNVTDESSAIEFAGYRSFIIEGHPDNIKITRPGDLELAEYYLSKLDPDFYLSHIGHRNKL